MVYLAIYNLEKREVEFEESYEDDAKVEDARLPEDDKSTVILEADLQAVRLASECLGRGTLDGEWKLYKGDSAFSWDAVEPPSE